MVQEQLPVKYLNFFLKGFVFLSTLYLSNPSAIAQTNHYIIIDTITIIGNKKTQAFVIQRELLFKKDSIYESFDLDKMAINSKNLLTNTNLFVKTEVKWTETKPKHVSILVEVIEKWYLWPIPFFELADRNYKQWADLDYKLNRTNFGLYLFTYNFRGRNETIKLSFINGYTQNYGLQYTVPFLDPAGKYGLDISTRYRQNKEIWYLTKNDSLQFYKGFDNHLIQRFDNKMAFTSRHNNFVSERWELEFNTVKLKDTLLTNQLNPNFILAGNRQRETSIKHIIVYEKRDNKYYPLKGYYFKNEVSIGAIKCDTIGIEQVKETIEFGMYREIYKKLYLSGFFKAKLSNEPKPFIPYNNYKAFGYKDYVRGYEQNVIDGHAFMLAKLNFKYAMLHQYFLKTPIKIKKNKVKLPIGIYLNNYIEWGKVYNNQWSRSVYNNQLINADLVGYGVGLDLLFLNDKILRFEYSANILGNNNFNLHFDKAF